MAFVSLGCCIPYVCVFNDAHLYRGYVQAGNPWCAGAARRPPPSWGPQEAKCSIICRRKPTQHMICILPALLLSNKIECVDQHCKRCRQSYRLLKNIPGVVLPSAKRIRLLFFASDETGSAQFVSWSWQAPHQQCLRQVLRGRCR